MSCAVTRTRLPALRTLPSRTYITSRISAIRRMSSCFPLNANADVRAMTFNPGVCASRLMISSARPSPKYSFSGSALRFVKDSTAIDADRPACRVPPRSSSAACTAPIVGNRRFGSFCRHRRTSASSSVGTASGGGSSRSTALSTAAVDGPSNARRPASSSYSTAPKLKTSDRTSIGCPCACSGDIYAAVPTTVPSSVRVVSGSVLVSFATPKSNSLAVPSSVTRTFDGFRSRWRIPLACAASSALATCRASRTAASAASGPRSGRPFTYSSTR